MVEETNRKAIQVLNRVKDKLTGKDFNNSIPIDELNQVDCLFKSTKQIRICLNNNKIKGKVYLTDQLSELKWLLLKNNQIEEVIINETKSDESYLEKLIEIDISFNKIRNLNFLRNFPNLKVLEEQPNK